MEPIWEINLSFKCLLTSFYVWTTKQTRFFPHNSHLLLSLYLNNASLMFLWKSLTLLLSLKHFPFLLIWLKLKSLIYTDLPILYKKTFNFKNFFQKSTDLKKIKPNNAELNTRTGLFFCRNTNKVTHLCLFLSDCEFMLNLS